MCSPILFCGHFVAQRLLNLCSKAVVVNGGRKEGGTVEAMAWVMIVTGCTLFGMLALWMLSDRIAHMPLPQEMVDSHPPTSQVAELTKAA
jgi:hypothetical protein